MNTLSGFWSAPRMTVLCLISLLAPLAEQQFRHGIPVAQNLLLAIAITVGWQMLFALVRKRSMTLDGLVSACLFTILVAPETPWSRIVIALSFGVVFGELIFGGRGRSFLNPVVVGLAFLFFSFPGSGREPITITVLAVVPALVMMTASGLVSWRVLLSAMVAYLLFLTVMGVPIKAALLAPGLVLFTLVFLIGDAVCCCATRPGRWAYGFLAGALIVLFSPSPNTAISVDALVFSALLASVFAPLLDHFAISLSAWRRGRRHD